MLCSLVLESFADSKLLDFSDLGQLTFRINRTLGVSRYIRHRPNSYIRMCEGYEGGVIIMDHDVLSWQKTDTGSVELGWLSGLGLVLEERWSWVRIPLDL